MKEENDKKIYVCEECLNNEYNLDNEKHRCEHCYKTNCAKCHFENNGNLNICDECSKGYYLNLFNNCVICKYPVFIPHGICKICSDDLQDYNSGECMCESYYTLLNNSICIKCPDNFALCEFNVEKIKLNVLLVILDIF